jgi:hypothetical protein
MWERFANRPYVNTKNLTAEVAEQTEVKKNKGHGVGARENWLHFQRFPKASHAEGLYIERSLRSLLPLCSASSLHPRRMWRKKEVDSRKGKSNQNPQRASRTQRGPNFYKMIRVFILFEENALRSLRALWLIFFSSSPEEARKQRLL